MVNQSTHTLSPASQVPFINQSPGQCTGLGQPPPLVPIASPSSATLTATSPIHPASQQRPRVESPFWVTFMFGNVSRCNGCKGKIARDPNKKALPPPDDIVLQHKEYVIYQNSRTGHYEQSRDVRPSLPYSLGKKSPVYGKWKEFYFVAKFKEQKLLYYDHESVRKGHTPHLHYHPHELIDPIPCCQIVFPVQF